MSFFSSKNKSARPSENGISKANPEVVTKDVGNADQKPPPATLSPQAKPPEPDIRPDLSPEDARKYAAIGKQFTSAFGELVILMMRSQNDRKRPISDLEWMISPAIATGQFAIADAQSKKTGAISPIGAVIWAMVSEQVDKRLSDPSEGAVRLNPKDWRSGTIPWIILTMGDKRVVADLIKKLTQGALKEQAPKIRSRDNDGKIVIGRVHLVDQSEAQSKD